MPGLYDAPGNFAPARATASQLGATDRMLTSMSAQLAELPPETLRRLMPVLQDARKELRTGLLEWLKNAPDGAKRFTAQSKRVALLNLETAIQKIRELEPAMADALTQGGAGAGELAIKHLREEVSRMGTVFGESLFASPQIRMAQVLTNADKVLIPRFRNSANRYAGNVLTDLNHQFGVAVSKGESYFQIQQRLRRLGGPRGLVALRGTIGDPKAIVEEISEGLFARYRHWANRLVRTEMASAYSHGHVQGVRDLNAQLEDDGDEYLLRWDARNDGQCPICQALDGTAVKVGEQFAPGIYRSPAHPNCLCRVGAWRKDWGDIPGEVGLRGPAPGPNAKGWPPNEMRVEKKPKPRIKRKAPLPMPKTKAAPPVTKRAAPSRKPPAVKPAPTREETLRALDRKQIAIDSKAKAEIDKAIKIPEKLEKELEEYKEKVRREWDQLLNNLTPEGTKRFDAIRKVKHEMDRRIDEGYDKIPGIRARVGKEAAAAKAELGTKAKAIRSQMTPDERSLHTARVGSTLKRNLTAGRVSIDGDLAAEGYHKRPGDILSTSKVKVRRRGVAGTHGWDGEILLSKDTAETSRLFLEEFAKSPAAAKKAMEESMTILTEARGLAQKSKKMSRVASQMLHEIDGDWKVKSQIRAAHETAAKTGRPPKMPLSVKGADNLADAESFFNLEAKADRLASEARSLKAEWSKTPGGKLLHNSTGHSTHVHEALHGHGNIEMSAYHKHGKMVEEVITEVTARDHMVQRYGVPKAYRANHGAYQGWIGGVRDELADIYKIPKAEASEIMTKASRTLKVSSEHITTPSRLVEAFAEAIGEASGQSLKPEVIKALGRVSEAWE